MTKSDSIKDLATALAKAQAEIKNPAFDAMNPHFKSKYASLASVTEAVLPVLSKHQLSLTQLPIYQNGDRPLAGCISLLMHASGQFIESELLLPLEKPNAHGAGSCLTYARRYSMMAIAGVVGDEDVDGNAATVQKTGLPTKAITPVDGSIAALPPAEQVRAKKIASSVVELWEQEKQLAAYELVYEGNHTNELILGVWEHLKPFSSIRSALKKMHAETLIPTQA